LKTQPRIYWFLMFMLLTAVGNGQEIFIGQFEADDYGDWQVSGDAFGPGPVNTPLPGLRPVEGFLGMGYVNSVHGGEASKGVLMSPSFVIERDYINFLVGGGYHPGGRLVKKPVDFWGDEVCVNLLVDPGVVPYTFDLLTTHHNRLAVGDHVVLRTKTGDGLASDGGVEMKWASWDVRSMRGKSARIRIVDNFAGPDGFICVDQIFQGDQPNADILSSPDLIRRADENVKRAKAKAPPRRGYHYQSRVFGFGGHTVYYHDGYYHLFYIYNPFGDRRDIFSHNFWAHARSKDLVYWEDLPPAIWPSEENGEFYCASGAVAVGDDGVPRIFYTSRSSERAMDQMAAVGDQEWVTWRKYKTNPVITNTPENPMTHGTDCALFKHENRWYMILGGGQFFGEEYKGCFSLYGSWDLIHWDFLSVPYVAETRGWEEPDMFPLGDKWVVAAEPFGPSQYFVGNFDWDKYKFTPEFQDYLDYAGVADHDPTQGDMHKFTGHFIFCETLEDGDGRRIGFGIGPVGLSLPRIFELRPDGRLGQRPVPELEKLRREHVGQSNIKLTDESRRVIGIEGDLLEIKVEFEPGGAEEFGLKVRCSQDGSRFVRIACDGEYLEVAGDKTPAKLMEGEQTLRLQVFLDKHSLEVFANDWVVYTESISVPPTDLGVEVFSNAGTTSVKSLDVWRLDSIWSDENE